MKAGEAPDAALGFFAGAAALLGAGVALGYAFGVLPYDVGATKASCGLSDSFLASMYPRTSPLMR